MNECDRCHKNQAVIETVDGFDLCESCYHKYHMQTVHGMTEEQYNELCYDLQKNEKQHRCE